MNGRAKDGHGCVLQFQFLSRKLPRKAEEKHQNTEFCSSVFESESAKLETCLSFTTK